MNDRFQLSDGSPNNVACPYCDAKPGEPCRKISGERASYPHSMRWQTWRGHVYYNVPHRPVKP